MLSIVGKWYVLAWFLRLSWRILHYMSVYGISLSRGPKWCNFGDGQLLKHANWVHEYFDLKFREVGKPHELEHPKSVAAGLQSTFAHSWPVWWPTFWRLRVEMMSNSRSLSCSCIRCTLNKSANQGAFPNCTSSYMFSYLRQGQQSTLAKIILGTEE